MRLNGCNILKKKIHFRPATKVAFFFSELFQVGDLSILFHMLW